MTQPTLPGLPHTSYSAWLGEEIAKLYPKPGGVGPPEIDPHARIDADIVINHTLPMVPIGFIPPLTDLVRRWHRDRVRAWFRAKGMAVLEKVNPDQSVTRYRAVQMMLPLREFEMYAIGKLMKARADVDRVTAEVHAWDIENPGQIANVDAFVKSLCKTAGIRAA